MPSGSEKGTSDKASLSSKPHSIVDPPQLDGSHPSSPTDITPAFNEIEETAAAQRAVRKFDLVVIPLITMFYLLSFLDRTNIGNARVGGLQADLGMSSRQFSMALTVTYIPYIAVEIPSNLILQRIGPNIMLPIMVAAWGLVTMLQGFVTSYNGLLAARFFLGLTEGGLLPGIILYMSGFYKRHQLQTRVALVFSATSLAGAFSGLLATAILNLNGRGGQPGWAWIFILEGLFTILFGIFSYFVMPRSPATAKFLTEEERAATLRVLKADYVPADDEPFSWGSVLSTFKAWQVWLISPIFFFGGVTLYGFAFFIPTIVNALGNNPIQSQLLSVPPFAVSFVTSLAVAIFSDKYRMRGLSTFVFAVIAMAGYITFLTTQDRNVRYGALFLQSIGAYGVAPTISAWNVNNLAAHYRRSTGVAIGFVMSNSGGILSTWIFTDPPHFRRATRIDIAASVLMGAFALANVAYLNYQNAQKAKEAAGADDSLEARRKLGDRHPLFKYTL